MPLPEKVISSRIHASHGDHGDKGDTSHVDKTHKKCVGGALPFQKVSGPLFPNTISEKLRTIRSD